MHSYKKRFKLFRKSLNGLSKNYKNNLSKKRKIINKLEKKGIISKSNFNILKNNISSLIDTMQNFITVLENNSIPEFNEEISLLLLFLQKLDQNYQESRMALLRVKAELYTTETLKEFLLLEKQENSINNEIKSNIQEIQFKILNKIKQNGFRNWFKKTIILLLMAFALNTWTKVNVPHSNSHFIAQVQSYFETGRKASKEELKNLKVIGHRGSMNNKSQNTLQNIKFAVQNKADFIEIDIQSTKDQQLIVFHDLELEKMTNQQGIVSESTIAQIQTAKYPNGEEIPSLEEVIDHFPNQNWVFDIKQPGISHLLTSFINEHKLWKNVIIIGTPETIIEYTELPVKKGLVVHFKEIKNLSRFLLYSPLIINQAKRLNTQLLILPTPLLYQNLIEEAKNNNLEVWSYGKDNQDDLIEKVNRGISGLIVDDVKKAKIFIKKM
jgi:glycerophosphoryl diester phosphodiesterase